MKKETNNSAFREETTVAAEVAGAPETKKRSVKKAVLSAVFILICVGSVGLTAFLDFGTDKEFAPFSAVAHTLGDNFIYILYALLCFVAVLVFKGAKRAILLNACLKKRNNFFLGLKTGICCKYYDAITPMGSGGQPMEIMYLKKHGISTPVASGVSVTSYAIGLISSVLLGIVMMLVCGFGGVEPIVVVLAVIGVVINIALPLAIVIFSAMPRVGAGIAKRIVGLGAKLRIVKDRQAAEEKAVSTMNNYAKSIRFFFGTYLFKTLLASLFGFAYNIALFSIPYFVLRAFGIAAEEINYFNVLERCLICYLAVTAIPTPGNAGAAEISFYAVFSSFLGGGYLFWSVIVWRFLTYYLFIIVGFFMTVLSKIFHRNVRGELAGVALQADALAEAERHLHDHSAEAAPPEEEQKLPSPQGEGADDGLGKNADNGVIGEDIPSDR